MPSNLIFIVAFALTDALRINWEPLEVTKVDTDIGLEEHFASDNVGNVLAILSAKLYNAAQCGHCGSQQVQMQGYDQKHVLKDLFGDIFPLKLDLSNSSCDVSLTCDRSNPKDCRIPKWDVTKKLFNRHLTPLLKDVKEIGAMREKLKDTLVVHLRGGNILDLNNKYEKQKRSTYLPAPCAYITDVIQRHNFEKVQLVGQMNHPCIRHIQATFSEAIFEDQSVSKDFKTLMSATNIALSTSSTFGMAATMMNPTKDLRIFMPTYRGKLCCEGSFTNERLTELCLINKQSVVYEILALTNNPIPVNRTAWVLDNSKFENAALHNCS